MFLSRFRVVAVMAAGALLALGAPALAAPAEAASAAVKDCTKNPEHDRRITAKETVLIRKLPVASGADNLGQINKGETTWSVKGLMSASKECRSAAYNEVHGLCGSSGTAAEKYYVVYVKRYDQIGFVPAPCFR